MHSKCMETTSYYSPRASLGLIAQQFKMMKLWSVVQESVVIPQKKVRYEPLDKLLDCLILILAGGGGLVEINTRVRNDPGLQRAFGRHECAEQSTISSTVNACTQETVEQMRKAMAPQSRAARSRGWATFKQIIQSHGQVMRRVRHDWLVLDVDMLGMVAGRQGEGVTKGYFSGGRNQRGRQLGRVLATDYDEIVAPGPSKGHFRTATFVDRLYNGKRQLESSLPGLIAAAEDTLKPDPTQSPENKVCRMDSAPPRRPCGP